MWILGISKSHNGSVALIHDGKIISAIQAERISRIKRYPIDLKNDKILIKKCIDYCEFSSYKHALGCQLFRG